MRTEHRTIRGVLFDLDDTLNDRAGSWMAYVHLLANPENALLRACDFRDVHRIILDADRGGYRPKEELFGDLCAKLPWKRLPTENDLEQHWRKHFSQCMVVRDGVLDVLSSLRKSGLRLGIVTNGRADSQNAKIAAMGLRPLVDAIVVSETVGIKKPQAGIFEVALKALGVPAAQTLFVGDNPRLDIWGPSQLGMRTAWFDTGQSYPDDIARADFESPSIPALFAAAGLLRTHGVTL